MNVFNETQDRDNDGLTPIKPEPQDEHHIHVEEEQAYTTIESEHPRGPMASNIVQISGGRRKQTAISVVVPMQQFQHNATADQQLSRNLNTMNVPIVRNNRRVPFVPSPQLSSD